MWLWEEGIAIDPEEKYFQKEKDCAADSPLDLYAMSMFITRTKKKDLDIESDLDLKIANALAGLAIGFDSNYHGHDVMHLIVHMTSKFRIRISRISRSIDPQINDSYSRLDLL